MRLQIDTDHLATGSQGRNVRAEHLGRPEAAMEEDQRLATAVDLIGEFDAVDMGQAGRWEVGCGHDRSLQGCLGPPPGPRSIKVAAADGRANACPVRWAQRGAKTALDATTRHEPAHRNHMRCLQT